MHISLDSALGRQKRLNQIGETITSIAAPTAAYSLRSLTGGDPLAVRVRRDSDNTERDFTISEVNSGAMLSFVNTQTVKPLDIRALESDGDRDGDFQIASAAYSLRSLGDRQATVTSSGDTAGDTSGKYVVQVRRNVNGDQKSFTADEVTDGTLLAFVNESFTSSLPLDTESGAAAAYSLRNLSTSYANGPVINVRRSSDDSTQDFKASEITDGTLATFCGTGDGFVTTWYDQSGNSKNATQSDTAKQPKIVNAGSVLKDSAELPEIDFDGTHKLDIDFGADLDQPNSIFMVHQSDGTSANSNEFFDSTGTGGVRSVFDGGSANYRLINNTTSPSTNVTFEASGSDFAIDTNKNIAVGIFNGSSSLIAKNGTADTGSTSAVNGQNEINSLSTIGLSAPNSNNGYDGTMQEFIVYNSDQTENRRALEESISGHYGISLASFNRNGFVRTWYDQSVTDQGGGTATGNHILQSVASKQPKIVNSGSLLSAGITFDGTDDELATASGAVITASNSGTFSAFSVQTIATGEDGYMYGNAAQSPSKGASFYARSEPDFVLSDRTSINNEDRISRSAGQNLLSCVYESSRASLLVNGSGTTTTEGTYGFDAGSLLFVVGNRNGGTSAGTFLSGSFQEIIIYNNDQTDNRGAFEGNMADHYNISGVPTEDNTVNGFVTKWYDQSGNNRPLIQTTATEQPLIVESGTFLNGVKSNKATSNSTMQNLQVSTDGTNANFGTDDWASGASSKLGLIYVGTVPESAVVSKSSNSVIWGGGRGVSGYQKGGLSLQVIKSGNDGWKLMNEREFSPTTMQNSFTLNSDNDIILYGFADNREFTINVNGSGDTETESADLDTNENTALSLFGAYDAGGGSYYQRSTGGVCKECYLYAGTNITSIPTIATKINQHYSIYS